MSKLHQLLFHGSSVLFAGDHTVECGFIQHVADFVESPLIALVMWSPLHLRFLYAHAYIFINDAARCQCGPDTQQSSRLHHSTGTTYEWRTTEGQWWKEPSQLRSLFPI